MYLIFVQNNSENGNIYEFSTYKRAKEFIKRNSALSATYIGKTKKIDNLDLFCERITIYGQPYQRRNMA